MGTTFGTDDPINEVPIMQFYDAKDFADSNKFNGWTWLQLYSRGMGIGMARKMGMSMA